MKDLNTTQKILGGILEELTIKHPNINAYIHYYKLVIEQLVIEHQKSGNTKIRLIISIWQNILEIHIESRSKNKDSSYYYIDKPTTILYSQDLADPHSIDKIIKAISNNLKPCP